MCPQFQPTSSFYLNLVIPDENDRKKANSLQKQYCQLVYPEDTYVGDTSESILVKEEIDNLYAQYFPGISNHESFSQLIDIIKEADNRFEKVGDGTKGYVGDCLLPLLLERNIQLTPIDNDRGGGMLPEYPGQAIQP